MRTFGVFVASIGVCDAYTWQNVTSDASSLPVDTVRGGYADVGGSKNATLSVCRSLNSVEKSGGTSWTPGHLTKYDGSFTESGYWCAFCMDNPSFCYLYDSSQQVLVLEDGETLHWEDSTGTVQDGAVEVGEWTSGPAGKYYVCRLNDTKNRRVLPGKLYFVDNTYRCCATTPVDNPSEICTTSWGDIQTYEALVAKRD